MRPQPCQQNKTTFLKWHLYSLGLTESSRITFDWRSLRVLHNWWIHPADVGKDHVEDDSLNTMAPLILTASLSFHMRRWRLEAELMTKETQSEITAARPYFILSMLWRLSFASLPKNSSIGRMGNYPWCIFREAELCQPCIVCKLLQELQAHKSRCVNTQHWHKDVNTLTCVLECPWKIQDMVLLSHGCIRFWEPSQLPLISLVLPICRSPKSIFITLGGRWSPQRKPTQTKLKAPSPVQTLDVWTYPHRTYPLYEGKC